MPTTDDADPSRRDPYDALAGHGDPLVREIGAQLRAGRIRPRDVLAAGAYRPVLLRALETVRRQNAECGEHG
ncbi:MAG TPA: hypothetical protein VGJ63_05270 [Micromonosporaceae bacterium]